MSSRRKPAKPADLRRAPPGRAPYKRVLIVCEGSETERRYFEHFVAQLRLSGVQIEVYGNGGSAPISVVRDAERLARREGHPKNGGYSNVFCVFDCEGQPTFRAALDYLHDLKSNRRFPSEIDAIVTTPCFEFWYILHFKYCRSPFSACAGKTVGESVVLELRKIKEFKEYSKSTTSDHLKILLPLTDAAIANAEKVRVDAIKSASDNPSTDVHILVSKLRDMKKTSEAPGA